MIAAFFDMDETLIGVNSGKLWVHYQWKEGKLSTTDLVKSLGYLLGYRLALVDVNRIAKIAVQRLSGQPESAMREEVAAWYDAEVRPHILPRMVEVVETHRARGHQLVLLTASSPYVAEPISKELGLDAFICTQFEVVDQHFTGALDGPMCYADGKVTRSTQWANAQNIALAQSYFYSDSFTDLPMFEAVGNPVAVNPDPRLLRHARRADIPILFTRDE